MKKGLLLSVVASTVLFAGGDIAPVQPVAEAPAAACDDFYGAAVVGVIYDDSKVAPAADVEVRAGAVLGVSKELFGGLVVNAEVQGATGLDYITATKAHKHVNVGSLNTLNLAYSFGNTAILVGRWSSNAGSNKNYFGLKKTAHEGVKIANTDIADTTITASYSHYKIDLLAGTRTLEKKINAEIVNKSFADTALTLGGDYELIGKTWDVYGSIDTKVASVDLSLGGKYTSAKNYVVGAFAKKDFEPFAIKVGVSRSTGGVAWSKYTDLTGVDATAAIGAKVSTKISGIGLWVGGDYQVAAKTWEAGVGASKTISGINFGVDYRRTSAGANRVRAKAVYAF